MDIHQSADEQYVIVSEIGTVYYIRIYAYLIALSICVLLLIKNMSTGHADVYWFLTVVLWVTGVLGRIFYVGKIKRITVSPDHILVDLIGNKPQWIIDYTQIVSDQTLTYFDMGPGFNNAGNRRQVIVLDDGSRLTYSNMKFENFDDLKNNIFRYMVAANQAVAREN